MKKNILAFLLLSSLLLIMSCNYKTEPIIKVKFDVTDLTEIQYSQIVTYGLKDPKKDDFKVINFSVHISNSKDFSNIKINFPSLDQVYMTTNSTHIERLWCFYPTFSPKDSTKFVLYYKGLDENDFKKLYHSLKVNVSWDSKSGKHNEKSLSVANYIRYK